MRVEAKKYLHDITHAADSIARFVTARSLADFENDAMLRSAVERQLEIIGEALAQLARLGPRAHRAHHRMQADHRVPEHPDPRLRRG